jgi:hypothetical protein
MERSPTMSVTHESYDGDDYGDDGGVALLVSSEVNLSPARHSESNGQSARAIHDQPLISALRSYVDTMGDEGGEYQTGALASHPPLSRWRRGQACRRLYRLAEDGDG